MSEEEENELIPDEFMNNEYDMAAEPGQHTGLVVIFNSCTYSANCLPTRNGSQKDVQSIKHTFGDEFGFEVRELRDLTKSQMEGYLKEIASSFKPPWRCLIIFFLSHGLGEEYLADFNGQRVNVRLLVQLFDGENCPKMIGKPKLFFAQMCRGFDREEYERSNHGYDGTADELFPESLPANISPHRDRLVCYATTEGRMAPMDPEKGSLFIQTLTKVLLDKKVIGKKTIEEVLGVVTLMVDKKAEEQYKVCPVFDSTLVGKLIFKPRPKELIAAPVVTVPDMAPEDFLRAIKKLVVN